MYGNVNHVKKSCRHTTCVVWIILLAPDSAVLPGFCWWGGFYSIKFPYLTRMVGILLFDYCIILSSSVDLFGDLHIFKHIIDCLICLLLQIPSLKVYLFPPYIVNNVQKYIVVIFFQNILVGIQPWEYRQIFIQLCYSCGKAHHHQGPRFMNGTVHFILLFRERVLQGKVLE